MDVLGLSSMLSVAFALRLVVSSYSGPCVRVERGSDHAQINVGFVQGYLDSQLLFNFGGDGKIIIFYDQSGGQNNAVAADYNTAPYIVRNAFPAVAGWY